MVNIPAIYGDLRDCLLLFYIPKLYNIVGRGENKPTDRTEGHHRGALLYMFWFLDIYIYITPISLNWIPPIWARKTSRSRIKSRFLRGLVLGGKNPAASFKQPATNRWPAAQRWASGSFPGFFGWLHRGGVPKDTVDGCEIRIASW